MDSSNGSRRRRSGGWLWRVILIACLVSAGSGAAWARSPTEGVAELGVRNLAASTVEIGGRTYRVNDRSVMVDVEGGRLTLRTLPVPDHDAAPNLRPVVTGRYSAVEVAGGLTLVRLELVEAPR